MPPVFTLSHSVLLIRGRGSDQEQSREVIAGGLLDTEALFHVDAHVKRGDVIEAELLDEPRIIIAVHPQMTMSGVSHYKADLEPLSVWLERQQAQSAKPVHQAVYGNVGNMAVVSGGGNITIHQTCGSTCDEVVALIDRMAALVQQSDEIEVETKLDYAIDAEQLKGELKRPKKDGSRIWTLVDKLSKIGGAVKLGELLWQQRQALDPLIRTLGL